MTYETKRLLLNTGSLAPTETRRQYHARFVRAGQVTGPDRLPVDLSITPTALQNALDKFNNRAVFIDHAAFFDYPSLDNLVGSTKNAAWNATDQAIEGTVELYNTPGAQVAAQLLDEILADPATAPDVGLSMVFYPVRNGEQITGITHIESIDLVFQPAADGRILQALSSHYTGTPKHTKENFTMPPEQPNSMDNPQAAPAPAALTPQQIVQTLFTSGLPQPSTERLAAQQYNDLPSLQAAIESERSYLAALSAPGVIQLSTPPRGGRISGMMDSLDRIQLATEALIAGVRPANGVRPLSGIRELYHLLSGDYEMSGVFQPERIGFANVTSSTMAGLVANALNKLIVNMFQSYPQWWEPITLPVDVNTMQQVKWISLGGVGELPTVAEGAAYTELTWDDNTETATFYKKGGYLGLTLEAIDKDDTSRISAAPQALAQAAWLTLSKYISTIFTTATGTGPNLADGNPLFYARTAGTNVGSTALSVTAWNAVRTAMRKFTELNSGERMGVICSPKFLVVPPDLEQTAIRIMASEKDYTYALSNGVEAPVNDIAQGNQRMEMLNSAAQRVIVVDQWTDTDNWAAVADPRLCPTIGIAYRYGRVPEIFSVASPTAGLMFTNDTLPVKVRFIFAASPMDWRGMYKMNVG